jgi:GTPase SAR1 family protein
MLDPELYRITGFIMPVGSGAVGKSSLALTLETRELPADWAEIVRQVSKTQNLEFRYATDTLHVQGRRYAVLQQYLVPPGQRDADITPHERSFEDVLEIYRGLIRRVDVVLLAYKINDLDSYHEVETWVEAVSGVINDRTSFVLVGTHLDQADGREVSAEMVKVGRPYVVGLIRARRPAWKGYVTSQEVSSVSGENIERLRKLISGLILLGAGVAPKA